MNQMQDVFFCDPRELPEEYRPADKIDLESALAYSKKILKEEKRYVTFEEMQRFVIKDDSGWKR